MLYPFQQAGGDPCGLASPIPDEGAVLAALDWNIIEGRLLRSQLALCRRRDREARQLGSDGGQAGGLCRG